MANVPHCEIINAEEKILNVSEKGHQWFIGAFCKSIKWTTHVQALLLLFVKTKKNVQKFSTISNAPGFP